MDILRKELDEIYAAQRLEQEELGAAEVEKLKQEVGLWSRLGRGCAVITDASCDRCYIYGGSLGAMLGFMAHKDELKEEDSSDEDIIYSRIHPEDLVDKRLLEYEFFRMANELAEEEKLDNKAVCRIRIKRKEGEWLYVDNTTRLIGLSPRGKIWLILCTYDLSADQSISQGIAPAIVDMTVGTVRRLNLGLKREKVLSEREKEILALIEEGLPSKLIADRLSISVHTVNRHRQNIISKLSVANSLEAIKAAKAMRLF